MQNYNLALVQAPTELPISKQDAKDHLRYEDDEEDSLVNSLIAAATDYAESFTRRRFITQTWKLLLDDFPRCQQDYAFPGEILLPYPPLQSVTHVKHYNGDGTLVTISSADYLVLANDLPGRVTPTTGNSWPYDVQYRPDAVEVQYVCGYGLQAAVPAAVKHAILLILGHLFENRQTVSPNQLHEIPLGAEHLLWPHRDFRA